MPINRNSSGCHGINLKNKHASNKLQNFSKSMSFACKNISLFLDAWDYIVQNVKLTNKGKNTVMLLLLLNVHKNKDVILIHCDIWNEMYEDRTFYQMIKIIFNLESIWHIYSILQPRSFLYMTTPVPYDGWICFVCPRCTIKRVLRGVKCQPCLRDASDHLLISSTSLLGNTRFYQYIISEYHSLPIPFSF